MFAEKLETLLHRAYHLQEDFGSTIPTDSVLADFGKSDVGFAYEFIRAKGIFLLSARVWLRRVRVRGVLLAESEGTLILPQAGSFHRRRDDDATTVTSDESFFSAAEVSPLPRLCKHPTESKKCAC